MSEKRTVVVIDDDEAIREYVEWALTDEGYEVVAVSDGMAALRLLEGLHPDLILLDLRMPGMDGKAFAMSYRSAPGPHAPIVVTSAARGERNQALEIEAAAHLNKPFDLADLLAVVERHIAVRNSDCSR